MARCSRRAPPAWWVNVLFPSWLITRGLKLPLSRLPRAAPEKHMKKRLPTAGRSNWPIPQNIRPLIVRDASDVEGVTGDVDFVFCAVDMKKDEIRALEDAYARSETPVVSNNSAHRGTPDVPMIVPELNPQHADIIEYQRKRLGTKVGFVTVKPNCSIQSYVPGADGAV